METTVEKRTIRPEDLFRFAFIADAKLSPDGKQVVYVRLTTDAAKEEDQTALWLLSVESGETRQLTAGVAHDGAPEWSPDGKQIAFVSARGGKPQVYRISVDGGEATPVTSLEQGVGGGLAWSPDGQSIAFTAGPVKPPLDPSKPYRVSRTIYRFDGMGLVENVLQDIYIVPAAGGEARLLTKPGTMNVNPVWSPDSREILYAKSFRADPPTFLPGLCVVDLEGNDRVMAETFGEVDAAVWTPDGQRIVFLGQASGLPVGSKSDLYVVDRLGGTPEKRTASIQCSPGGHLQGDMPAEPMPRILVDGDNHAYINVQEGGTVQIYRVALTGPEEYAPVVTGERYTVPLGLKAGRLLYAVSLFLDPTNLFIAGPDGKNERQLTHLNDELLAGFKLPTVEHLSFPAVDSIPLEGWYLKPAEGEAPYATVLYIHGGPHSGFGNVFSLDFQMLCGAGYGVLAVNQRGSTGYGDGFSTQIIGDWGNLDYKDLISGVDAAIAKGLADPDRLGCCGISGGGNLSTWIVGQTDRFKAAVPENPVTNWLSMYGNGDLSGWFAPAELGGLPHEIPEIYVRCSPITYAHNCKTPTLLLQGECDHRCPPEQSEQFYSVLKHNGCTVEMVRFPGSPHAGSIMGPVPIRKAQNEALLGWMNKYLMGKSE